MIYWTDLYLLHDVSDAAIVSAVASALRVGPGAVAVGAFGTPLGIDTGPEPTVIVKRQDLRRFGEGGSWPVELSISIDGHAPEHELATLRAIAAGLATPFIVNLTDDGQDMFRLVMPDGYAPARLLNDDDEPELTIDDHQRLARYTQAVHAA
ncbi:MAG: hypothetical protein QM753_02275 [Thermomicrobiales bacterium]